MNLAVALLPSFPTKAIQALTWTHVVLCGFGVSALVSLPAQGADQCDAMTGVEVVCTCDVRTLRPLQGAVGLEEVKEKADKIGDNLKKARKKLEEDPIKVVHGPGGALFITDHHHGAYAWLRANHPDAVCEIRKGPAFNSENEFWSGLTKLRLVHLADADSKPITPQELPRSLDKMGNDPYRSLAWRLRKKDGFCRSLADQKEFVEFAWADRLRTMQNEFPPDAVKTSSESFIEPAKKFALSAEAKDLPGYIGDKGAGYECPEDE
ncbi:MAG: hypothetical protein QOG66_2403 [Methylobacteriaceae bacterium]|jgi:hypothetical protein|nr:hypothetical protein [Methylobacteriaceae bacterium]